MVRTAAAMNDRCHTRTPRTTPLAPVFAQYPLEVDRAVRACG